MTSPPDRVGWVALAGTVCGLWLAATGAVVALVTFTGLALPAFAAKSGPFLVAGLGAGRLVRTVGRRPKVIAAAVLALVADVAWTSFTLASRPLPVGGALTLFAASLPVFGLGGLFAYLGMQWDGRGTTADPELDDLERDLQAEHARRRDSASSP